MSWAQIAIDGVALGAAYALVALGFVLILNATGAVNFAQGDLVMAGGFAAVALTGIVPVGSLALPGMALAPLVAVAGGVAGWIIAEIAYRPLRRRPPVAVFVSTIAVGIMLQHGANGLFGAAERRAPPLVAGEALTLGPLTLSRQSLAIVVAAAAVIVLLHLLLERTQLGRRLRAAAEDAEMARALGIRVRRLTALAFALGAALAALAGMLLANVYFVTPTAGLAFMLKAYIAVTIGGWGSLRGAVTGALLVALFEVFAGRLFSASIADALLYGALLAVLLLKPEGLFGEAAGRRA
ncbi:MAG: branched-chain amino acid ABC transporter permease [Rhodospirillaceae bacterium]|nr:branched-chain amino acid ABC transporter permease [Rhodospirillaceae bacterium]